QKCWSKGAGCVVILVPFSSPISFTIRTSRMGSQVQAFVGDCIAKSATSKSQAKKPLSERRAVRRAEDSCVVEHIEHFASLRRILRLRFRLQCHTLAPRSCPTLQDHSDPMV